MEGAVMPFPLGGEKPRGTALSRTLHPPELRAAETPQASWRWVLHLLAAAFQIRPVGVSALEKDSAEVSRGLLQSPLPQAAPLHTDTCISAFATILRPPRPT